MTETLNLLTRRPEQVAQHPDNVRDPDRDIAALAASIKKIGILVPLIVVPVEKVDGSFTHAAGTSTDRRRERHVTISVLAKVLAGETIAPEGTCQAFAIHPDRSAVLIDAAGSIQTLWPAADGLYDLGALGIDQ